MLKRTFGVFAILTVGCYAGIDSDFEEQRLDDDTLEIVDNLKDAGFPESEIGVLEDGTVFVGMDAVVTLEASREMAGSGDFRQYTTNNLVDSSISVICIDGSDFNNNVLDAALDGAINRYNSEGLSFDMERRDNGDSTGCDAEIVANQVGGSGGLAGFPSGGQPYGTFDIGQGIANYGEDVVRHVIMHELGHCIGFRHTDYFNRSISCGGSPSDEGEGGVGANHIPGTPTGAVYLGSVMNACYSTEVSGEWDSDDVTALNHLYGGGGGDGGGGPVCGDGVCNGGEDCGSCEDDCGACPVCLPKGASCTSNSDCCNNKCKGGGGNKSCK